MHKKARFILKAIETCSAEQKPPEAYFSEEEIKHVGYSKYHLCHSFKQLTGSTVVTYINTLKTDQAAKRLEEGNVPVSRVALECGYNDVCYFTKTFKKYKGVSPSEYGRKNEGR